jgi:hypothetical protein
MDDGKGQPWPNHVGVGIVFGPKNSNEANYQGSDCQTGVCAQRDDPALLIEVWFSSRAISETRRCLAVARRYATEPLSTTGLASRTLVRS